MAQVKDNPITEGFSGKFGRRLVFRHMKDGRTIVATRPDYTDHKWTPDQRVHHNRFQQAAAYARAASRTIPLYAELARGTPKNAYNLALSDWFHPPVIHEVTRQGENIRVNATDNVQVARVRIKIMSEEGQTLEQCEAASAINDDWWEFQTSTDGKLIVEAFDLAGNITKREA
jgi:hypothetical protein